MADAGSGESASRAEIVRLNKIIGALMNRAERSTNIQGSDFSLFASTIILEAQVRNRTQALETALRENKQTTMGLRESEARFRAVVNQSLLGIAMVENFKFSYTNFKFDEIFGYTSEEMHQLGPLDLVVADDVPLVTEQMRRRLSGEVDAADYTFRARRRDGMVVTIESQGRVIIVRGNPILVSMAMDVTERNRIEHEVRALGERLREESIHDALTGLYNRRYLDENLSRELQVAHQRGRRVGAIMGDIDQFKAVNDRYGHLAGDEVLRVFGRVLKRNSRETDLVCRYGGEEFVLILPGMNEAAAFERAEQLRGAIEKESIPAGATAMTVTASFGVAEFPQHGKSDDELIAAADRALYAAKAAGRNQVKSFSSLGVKC